MGGTTGKPLVVMSNWSSTHQPKPTPTALPIPMPKAEINRRSKASARNIWTRENPTARATVRSTLPTYTATAPLIAKVSKTATVMADTARIVRPFQPPPASGLRSAVSTNVSRSRRGVNMGVADCRLEISSWRSEAGEGEIQIWVLAFKVPWGRRSTYSR